MLRPSKGRGAGRPGDPPGVGLPRQGATVAVAPGWESRCGLWFTSLHHPKAGFSSSS